MSSDRPVAGKPQPEPTPVQQAEILEQEITAYLAQGGLFNPEMAQHNNVCDLLMRCRDVVAALRAAVSPQAQVFTDVEVLTILRNVGVDVECGACCEIAFTGVTTNQHTCKQLRAAVSGEGTWQPIATAPKDADLLLLCGPLDGVRSGYWDDDSHQWMSVETKGLTGGWMTPTLWQPMPAAPQEDSQ